MSTYGAPATPSTEPQTTSKKRQMTSAAPPKSARGAQIFVQLQKIQQKRDEILRRLDEEERKEQNIQKLADRKKLQNLYFLLGRFVHGALPDDDARFGFTIDGQVFSNSLKPHERTRFGLAHDEDEQEADRSPGDDAQRGAAEPDGRSDDDAGDHDGDDGDEGGDGGDNDGAHTDGNEA